MCVGVDVKVGEEVEGVVLEVGEGVARLSLNPALVEGSSARRDGEEERKKKRKSLGHPQADVSTYI